MKKSHPALNGKITCVFLRTFDNQDGCLSIDSHKSNIDFSSNIGKDVAKAICNEVSDFYRADYARGIEADNRFSSEYDWNIITGCDITIGEHLYLREVYLCDKGAFGFTSKSSIPRMDGVKIKITEHNYAKIKKFVNQVIRKEKKKNPKYELLGEDLKRYCLSKEDLMSNIHIIEFKNQEKATEMEHISQLTDYAELLSAFYGIKKSSMQLTLIGNALSNTAMHALNAKKKNKYKIQHVLYNELAKSEWHQRKYATK